MFSRSMSGFWLNPWNRLAAAFVIVGLVSISLVAFQDPPRELKAQPLLLELADRQPDKPVKIIVQKAITDFSVEKSLSGLGGTVTKDLHIINAFAAELPARQIPTLALTTGVRWVSLDAPVEKSGKSDDDDACQGCIDSSNLQSIYNNVIESDRIWNESPRFIQGQGIGVAILDSGITPLSSFQSDKRGSSSRILATVQTNNNARSSRDKFGHGTHVAGIIGGNGAASDGAYIGVAPNVNLLNIKVTDEEGSASTSDVVCGMQWIYNNRLRFNIRVVNISLNSSVTSSYLNDPLDAAAEILWFNKIVVVASAGNRGSFGLTAPANDPFVITVGATDDKATSDLRDDTVASFSAYGSTSDGFSKPDLVAPGVNIISDLGSRNEVIAREHPDHLVGKSLFRMSGTSTSAPMVTGAVALLLQSNPELNPDQVKYRLKATAVRDTPRWHGDTRLWRGYDSHKAGAGLLDVYTAIHSNTTATANTGTPASSLLWTGPDPVTWGSVNWTSVNWTSVNWTSDFWD